MPKGRKTGIRRVFEDEGLAKSGPRVVAEEKASRRSEGVWWGLLPRQFAGGGQDQGAEAVDLAPLLPPQPLQHLQEQRGGVVCVCVGGQSAKQTMLAQMGPLHRRLCRDEGGVSLAVDAERPLWGSGPLFWRDGSALFLPSAPTIPCTPLPRPPALQQTTPTGAPSLNFDSYFC